MALSFPAASSLISLQDFGAASRRDESHQIAVQNRNMELVGRAATHLRGIEDPAERAASFEQVSRLLGENGVDISQYREQATGPQGNAFLDSAIAATTKRTEGKATWSPFQTPEGVSAQRSSLGEVKAIPQPAKAGKAGLGTNVMQNALSMGLKPGTSEYNEYVLSVTGKGGVGGKLTTAIQEYQYAVKNDGYKGSFTQWKKENRASSSVNVNVGMPGVSKSDISKETLRTVKAASGLAAASDLVKQYRTLGEGVAGVRGKIGELGGAISATGVPGVKEFGETVTKRATGVSQRQLSDLRRSGRAFIAQNVPEITAEDSGRVTKEELRITGEADKILEVSSSYDEIIGALQAAVSAKYTAYHKSQYIRTGKPKFNLVAGNEGQQRSEQLRFVEELLALDPDMDREVAARALQRMITFQKLEDLDK